MPTRNILALLATVLLIVAARLYWVETYAIRMPFWDQWDAEGDYLLKPWIEGRLRLRDFWQPHNEHRIFPTRILSLLVFSFTGVWDNLIEARVNILVAACIPVIMLLFLMRQKALFGFRWLILIVILAQFCLPFSFENLLVGFQSQFYFLIIFTLFAIILASQETDNWSSMAGVAVLSWLSVLTMASGILTPLTAAAVYTLRAIRKREVNGKHIGLIAALLVLAVAGYSIMPQIEGNHSLRSRSIPEMRHALRIMLSWPALERWSVAIKLWVPAVIMVPWLLHSRKLSRADLFMAGCVVWSLAQTVAIAYGRGQSMISVSSRYTELFTPGLIASAWFAARFMEITIRRCWYISWLGVIFFTVYLKGHYLRHEFDMRDVNESYNRSLKQESNVRRYLQTGDRSALVQPLFEIPFPDSVRLRGLLDDPTLRPILPPNLLR